MPIVVQAIAIEPGIRTWSQTAGMRDISLQGLAFTCGHAYAVDSQIEVRMVLGITPYAVRAVVLKTSVEQKGKQQVYEVGVQFLKGGDIEYFIPALAKYLCHRFHQETEIQISPRLAAYKNK